MSNQQSLFNRSPLIHHAEFMPEPEQAALKHNANDQERRVLNYLREHHHAGASQIWQAVRVGNEPLTSYRRALTNLQSAGLVEKMAQTVTGVYGKQEHTWKFVE